MISAELVKTSTSLGGLDDSQLPGGDEGPQPPFERDPDR